jgi:hypothetical protein
MVFMCKGLGGTRENSQVPGSFEMWPVVNDIKMWCGWAMAVAMRTRRIFSNIVELTILFEIMALLLLIHREKNKTLGRLLF